MPTFLQKAEAQALQIGAALLEGHKPQIEAAVDNPVEATIHKIAVAVETFKIGGLAGGIIGGTIAAFAAAQDAKLEAEVPATVDQLIEKGVAYANAEAAALNALPD